MSIKFCHVQSKSFKQNGITIAYRTHDLHKLTFAIAQCSNKDAFSKKKGRETAEKHFNEGNHLTIRLIPKHKYSIHQFFEGFAEAFPYK